jgi:hypothetical protein
MKTLILAILLFIFSNSLINAQNYYQKSTIYSGNETYKCTVRTIGTPILCSLGNIKNKIGNQRMILPHGDESFNSITGMDEADQTILNIFRKIMYRGEILKMNEAKDRILITFSINDSGKILELGFLMNQNTSFNPKHLAPLEQEIKERVVFTFSSNAAKGANFLQFTRKYQF